jgi:dienelactone hydrolase
LRAYAVVAERESANPDFSTHSVLLHHDRPSQRCFLLLHGFTACPEQFLRLAESIHAAGHNVYVPLAEGHGFTDGSARHLSELTAEGIAQWIDAAVDLAAGLGAQLTVAGLSFGGVCTAWAARNRDVVDEAVIIAPSFLPRGVPVAAARILPAYIRRAPERLRWWDPVLRDQRPMAPYSYRQVSQRGIGAVFELGQRAWHGPAQRTTSLSHAALVLNARDMAISAPAARRAFASAIEPLAQTTEVHLIGSSLRFPHDFLDPWGAIGDREPEGRARLLDILNVTESTGAVRPDVDDS